MKIDYLESGADDCPLIRFFEFDPPTARWLVQLFKTLATGTEERFSVSSAPGIESVDGTEVVLGCVKENDRIVEVNGRRFEVLFTQEQWQKAAELAAPFGEAGYGYTWLSPEDSEIQLLMSRDGGW